MNMQSNNTSNLARLRTLAVDTFGSELVAESWLNQHHELLGAAPIVAVETSSGFSEVQKILSAINYGGVA